MDTYNKMQALEQTTVLTFVYKNTLQYDAQINFLWNFLTNCTSPLTPTTTHYEIGSNGLIPYTINSKQYINLPKQTILKNIL